MDSSKFTSMEPQPEKNAIQDSAISRLAYRAMGPILPSLRAVQTSSICHTELFSECRDASCRKSHAFVLLEVVEQMMREKASTRADHPNILLASARPQIGKSPGSYSDGPGQASLAGPRHDNDFQTIEPISVLPTTDEVLSRRAPFLPKKDACFALTSADGEQRIRQLSTTLFRHLRFDALESVIDATHTGLQMLMRCRNKPPVGDYTFRRETANGTSFSLFLGAALEEVSFLEHVGTGVQISFACPLLLCGHGMVDNGVFEQGMLACLITFNKVTRQVGTVFLRTVWRLPNQGREDNPRAAAVMSLADAEDIAKVRELVYDCRMLRENLVCGLVDYGSIVPAGFVHHLKRLQHFSSTSISEQLSSTSPLSQLLLTSQASPAQLDAPEYSKASEFQWNLECLKKDPEDKAPFILSTNDRDSAVAEIKSRTTLDHGQSKALYNNLNLRMAFTQGPPGTGKSFLAIATARVLLASVLQEQRGPIIVVAQTNHTLDDTLEALITSGVQKVARAGSNSKSDLLNARNLVKTLSRKRKLSESERAQRKVAGMRVQMKLEAGENLAAAWSNNTSWIERIANLKIDEDQVSDDTEEQVQKWRTYGGKFAGRDSRSQANTRDGDSTEDFRSRNSRKVNNAKAEQRRARRKAFLDLPSQEQCDAFVEHHRRFTVAREELSKAIDVIDANTLQKMEVAGFTSTAIASQHAMLLKVRPKILLIEEASELTEVHTLCAMLPSIEHVIAIGDPRQLRPHIAERVLELSTCNDFRFDESLFERLTQANYPFEKLYVQRRAHPDLVSLIQITDYPYVINHESTRQREEVRGMVGRMQWLDHDAPEALSYVGDGLDNKSWSNKFEAEYAVHMSEWLVEKQGYQIGDITILTPYNGQLNMIKRLMDRRVVSVILRAADKDVLLADGGRNLPVNLRRGQNDGETEAELERRIATGEPLKVPLGMAVKAVTIDDYQGEEAPVVIFSAVRSSRSGRIGFLGNENRINVAISRARNGFFVLGNAGLLEKESKFWKRIIRVFESKGGLDRGFHVRCLQHPESYNVVSTIKKGAFDEGEVNRRDGCPKCAATVRTRPKRAR